MPIQGTDLPFNHRRHPDVLGPEAARWSVSPLLRFFATRRAMFRINCVLLLLPRRN